jgi:hypothetical protein
MTRDQVIAAVGEPDARVQPGAHIDDATNTTWYPSQNFAVRHEAFVYYRYSPVYTPYRFCVLFNARGKVERVLVSQS